MRRRLGAADHSISRRDSGSIHYHRLHIHGVSMKMVRRLVVLLLIAGLTVAGADSWWLAQSLPLASAAVEFSVPAGA